MTKKIIALTTLAAFLLCTPLMLGGTAYAADRENLTDSISSTSVTEEPARSAEIIKADTLLLHLAPGASVDVMEATITQNGVTEELPVRAVDRNGSPVWGLYLLQSFKLQHFNQSVFYEWRTQILAMPYWNRR